MQASERTPLLLRAGGCVLEIHERPVSQRTLFQAAILNRHQLWGCPEPDRREIQSTMLAAEKAPKIVRSICVDIWLGHAFSATMDFFTKLHALILRCGRADQTFANSRARTAAPITDVSC